MTHRAPGLYLDEDVSAILAAVLRARGFDVLTTRDAGRLGHSDVDQLAYASETSRLLLTHNRSDYQRLHEDWLSTGRLHAGIIVARRRPPREVAARVATLLSRLTAEDLRGQLFFAWPAPTRQQEAARTIQGLSAGLPAPGSS